MVKMLASWRQASIKKLERLRMLRLLAQGLLIVCSAVGPQQCANGRRNQSVALFAIASAQKHHDGNFSSGELFKNKQVAVQNVSFGEAQTAEAIMDIRIRPGVVNAKAWFSAPAVEEDRQSIP